MLEPHPDPDAPDPVQRRAIVVEITIVLVVTFGLSGAAALLSLIEDAARPGGLADQQVALNPTRSLLPVIDLLRQLLGVLHLLGWAALGGYLLYCSGATLRSIGLDRLRARADLLAGLGLAALIGIPGLGLYLLSHQLGFSVTVVAAEPDAPWWRLPLLVLTAIANSVAEEVVVVAYLLTRLRHLGWSANRSLLASALLRGSYHLYQGVGGGLGNVVMGVIFGRYWQRTGRLWPLIGAHALIDCVAYLGYSLLRGRVGWLP